MIAGVRQFKLINGNGQEYDMTRPDALLHAPDGLGWGTERTVNRLGMTYIGINEKEIHQSPSGEMVFRTYEEYGRFLSFCQQGGLVLCYKPIDTWYYCECLISIQKSEIQWENNHLICPVQFTLLSYWYERVVAQTAEPPEPVEPSYRTVTGDPAVFNARYSYPIKDLSVAIQGSQELNGYDKPWVGGAGKNKLPKLTAGTYSQGGVAIVVDEYGVATMSGTTTSTANISIDFEEPITITQEMVDGGMYYHMNNSVVNRSLAPSMETVSGSVIVAFSYTMAPANRVRALRSVDVGKTISRARFYITSGITISGTYAPAFVYSSTATAYEPYSNICPITSYTSVTLTQSGSTTNTYDVELTGAGQVYKGTLDVTSGELVVTEVEIEVNPNWYYWSKSSNYPGGFYVGINPNNIPLKTNTPLSVCSHRSIASTLSEYVLGTVFVDGSLNFRWMSPTTTLTEWRDYISAQIRAGTPITVAGQLPTPQTYTLTPTQLSNLIGQNSIKADAGAVTVTYRTDARTEYKIYPYQYSYKYGDTAQNVFDISCDLPSYFKLTIFGEATNPSWRVVQNGSIVKSGKLNATIGSSQKLVINTDPKQTEIALYTLSNTRINNLYGYSDFATERIFALPQGESQVQVLTEDEQSPKVMIEVLKHV